MLYVNYRYAEVCGNHLQDIKRTVSGNEKQIGRRFKTTTACYIKNTTVKLALLKIMCKKNNVNFPHLKLHVFHCPFEQ